MNILIRIDNDAPRYNALRTRLEVVRDDVSIVRSISKNIMNRGRHLEHSSSSWSRIQYWTLQSNRTKCSNFSIKQIIRMSTISTTAWTIKHNVCCIQMLIDADSPSARSHDQRSMLKTVHKSKDQECMCHRYQPSTNHSNHLCASRLQHPCRSLGCLSKVVLIGRLRMAAGML